MVGFEVDIRFTYPDGTPFRRRIKAPVESKSAARRWGEARESVFLRAPPSVEQPDTEPKEIPTLRQFGPRFVDNYARANRQKASTIASKESILKAHLYPRLGDRRLDAIDDEDVQALKASLAKPRLRLVKSQGQGPPPSRVGAGSRQPDDGHIGLNSTVTLCGITWHWPCVTLTPRTVAI
jgi:hypothetical protein